MTEPQPTSAPALVAALGSELGRLLEDVLPTGCRRVALVDFPRHRNSGDSAIWAGERRALAALGVGVVGTAERQTFDLARLGPDPRTPVLLHGGGNFGDLYPGHQRLRERVFEECRGRPVVQLAQSLWFSEASAIDRCARLIAGHGDVTLLVRDERSFELATRSFDARVEMCPDFAFALGPLRTSRRPRHPVVRLARTDREQPDRDPAHDGFPRFDWLSPPRGRRAQGRARAWRSAFNLAAGGGRLTRTGLAPTSLVLRLYDAFAAENVTRATRLLDGGEVVVTDRLHGHILCTLLDKPHVILDDRFGKVSSFHARWTSSLATAQVVRDEREIPAAIAAVRAAAGSASAG